MAPELVAPQRAGRTRKPTSAKCSSSNSTATVLTVAGFRTVEPTRTTVSATFPPSRTWSTDEFIDLIVPVAPADCKPVKMIGRIEATVRVRMSIALRAGENTRPSRHQHVIGVNVTFWVFAVPAVARVRRSSPGVKAKPCR